MMSSKGNRFGIGPVDEVETAPRRPRDVGPMGVAVRDTASSLQASSDALVEQRRQNAADAKSFRQAQEEGRVLVSLPIEVVLSDDLPRDRIDLGEVAASEGMDELKTSIRSRGQKEPIEVFRDREGRFQLKKGWRRLTALRQLHEETGEERFSRVVARVTEFGEDRIDLYIDMVEENVVREDLTFAEMAQVAIDAARDPAMDSDDPDVLVGRLYGSLHKMKRSYIRSFVALLTALEGDLRHPKAVSRNLGVEVARRLKEGGSAEALRAELAQARGPEGEVAVLARFCESRPAQGGRGAAAPAREKFEFHVGGAKVTARAGECRIKSRVDFTSVDRAVLERAISAFAKIIEQG